MPPVDFRLAPRPLAVDGLLAVPIDIQSVQASVTFDGAASTAQVDTTMSYVVGPDAGNPFFDLRQTIGQAWLDGTSIAPAQLAPHVTGGDAHSTVRVLASFQAAGSAHTLRFTYTLAIPQAELGGAYPPALQWTAGPRLRWTLGMTDLRAGRYLEAWFPANLPFDQYPFDLDLQITGTTQSHALISNGAITMVGSNHWQIHFPDWFASFSPLIEVRSSDALQRSTGSVVLPVSGTTVTLEAWKLTGNPEPLAARLTELAGLLATNETAYGAFTGDRFILYLNGAPGGMEYAGATTTSVGAMAHETFHSWFARGIAPSSQADAWWDEGYTTFNDEGADDAVPFDFTEPPVTLCSRAPFQRRTADNAYDAGSRFFRGVGAAMGLAPLRAAMRALYLAHVRRPVSTPMVEEHLVATSGVTALVDGFHHFAYGYADAALAPKLWLRDAVGHAGADLWAGAFWDSPDLWVRRADDGGLTHESPEYGQDNWLYARVRNDASGGTCRHFVLTFQVREYVSTEFVYPADFLPCVAARAEFDLAPGQTRVVSVRWPRDRVPPPGTHPCLLAAVHARGDHPVAGTHVWEHANLAQKNLTVVDLSPGDFIILPVVLPNRLGRKRAELEIWRDRVLRGVHVSLVHRSREFFGGAGADAVALTDPDARADAAREPMDCGGAPPAPRPRIGGFLTSADPKRVARRFPGGVMLPVPTGDREGRARIPVQLAHGGPTVVGLRVVVPRDAAPGSQFTTHLAHRDVDAKRLVGGAAVTIRVCNGTKPGRPS